VFSVAGEKWTTTEQTSHGRQVVPKDGVKDRVGKGKWWGLGNKWGGR